jgi:anti-sigma factor RsiW
MTSPPNRPETGDASDAALDAALRDLHRDVLTEPVPPSLRDAARRVSAMQHNTSRGWHWASMAAGVMLAFGVGWFSHGQLAMQPDASATLAKRSGPLEFVRQAGLAYAVYMPEKRHPVEVAASEQEHLVQWLSKRVGKQLKVPKLDAQGFDLVGGRLLPGDSGARAQFMFQNSQGQRVTLYLGAIENTASATDTQATQFRFAPDGPVPSFYWADQGFAYALSGQVDKVTLLALANTVYSQIN